MVNMQRVKIIRRIGDSIGVIFNKEEQKLFNLSVGDTVDIKVKKLKDGGEK